MPRQIYINLPVKDLNKTKNFYAQLGFEFNPQFSDEKAACLIIGENIYAMLLTEPYFKTFIKKEIADAKKTTEVLICINADSKNAVNEMIAKAKKAGGIIPRDPQDHGFMYVHAFDDLDGHTWEIAWMDPNAVPPQG